MDEFEKESYFKKIDLYCVQCNKKYQRPPSGLIKNKRKVKNHFCSKQCYHLYMQDKSSLKMCQMEGCTNAFFSKNKCSTHYYEEKDKEEKRKKYHQLFQKKLSQRYKRYRYRAKKKNISFELTEKVFEDITKEKCFYCQAYSPNENFSGIDRIVPEKGYSIDNCVPCCSICNYMKSDWSIKEFREHIERIYNGITRCPKN